MSIEKICTERDFLALKNTIYKKTSLDCNQYKDPYLKRRFGVRMRVHGIDKYAEYSSLLNKDRNECDELMRDLTINVTQFFRDIPVFKVIEEELLPMLIYRKVTTNSSSIRIWSAGCSSGEEPYSMAIIMRDLLGEQFDSFHTTIIGSDIDEESLVAAREGSYLPRQMVNVPKEYLEKYFSFDGQMHKIAPEIKEMVEFKNVDLFTSTAGTGFDVILCRNVVIYFTKEMQERLYMKFYKALNPDGYFIMGNTETLVGEATKHLISMKSRERVYQKNVD